MNVRSGAGVQKGLGDGFEQALQLVAAPVLFGLLGWWLDELLDVKPLLMITLGVFGVVGAIVATSLKYLARSAQLEEGKPWTRRR